MSGASGESDALVAFPNSSTTTAIGREQFTHGSVERTEHVRETLGHQKQRDDGLRRTESDSLERGVATGSATGSDTRSDTGSDTVDDQGWSGPLGQWDRWDSATCPRLNRNRLNDLASIVGQLGQWDKDNRLGQMARCHSRHLGLHDCLEAWR